MGTKTKHKTVAEASGLLDFEGVLSIAYDATLRRPGCAIMQSVMGATIPHSALDIIIGVEYWVVHPTPDMKLYEVTAAQLKKLGEITRSFNKGKNLRDG